MSDIGGLEAIYLRLAPEDIALVKFVFESYEEVGVVRTLDRHAATIVALVARDFLADAHAIIADLQTRARLEVIDAPPNAGEDWLIKLMLDDDAE